jgi:hypothetical protein
MIRIISLFFFLSFVLKANAQEITPNDRIQEKVILYLPNHTKAQLENLGEDLKKIRQIKTAVFAPSEHNCLLLDIKTDNEIQFYSDIIKIVSARIPFNEIKLKTPAAYDQINGKGDNNTFIILKK